MQSTKEALCNHLKRLYAIIVKRLYAFINRGSMQSLIKALCNRQKRLCAIYIKGSMQMFNYPPEICCVGDGNRKHLISGWHQAQIKHHLVPGFVAGACKFYGQKTRTQQIVCFIERSQTRVVLEDVGALFMRHSHNGEF
jgi:hypothetical protein